MMFSMEREIPKPIKGALRELAELAHERAMTLAIEELAADFDLWRQGEISPFELAHRIHKFHQGPDRQIHLRYTRGADLPFLVVQSIREGLIPRESIPEEVLPYLDSAFELFRDLDKQPG